MGICRPKTTNMGAMNERFAFFGVFSKYEQLRIVIWGHRFPFLPHEGVLGMPKTDSRGTLKR